MNTHCEICGEKHYSGQPDRTVIPLSCDDRFCENCAVVCCESAQAMMRHTRVGETKEFTYPRWIWDRLHSLFTNATLQGGKI